MQLSPSLWKMLNVFFSFFHCPAFSSFLFYIVLFLSEAKMVISVFPRGRFWSSDNDKKRVGYHKVVPVSGSFHSFKYSPSPYISSNCSNGALVFHA